jgi:hypothetical protein
MHSHAERGNERKRELELERIKVQAQLLNKTDETSDD